MLIFGNPYTKLTGYSPKRPRDAVVGAFVVIVFKFAKSVKKSSSYCA
jgi:hypothetical protein